MIGCLLQFSQFETLRIGSKIKSHSVRQNVRLLGLLPNRLCEVIFVRALTVFLILSWGSVNKKMSYMVFASYLISAHHCFSAGYLIIIYNYRRISFPTNWHTLWRVYSGLGFQDTLLTTDQEVFTSLNCRWVKGDRIVSVDPLMNRHYPSITFISSDRWVQSGWILFYKAVWEL